MAEHKLTIHVDQNWLPNFNKNNVKLCFSVGAALTDNTDDNVAAYTTVVASEIIIMWGGAYSIAATKDSVQNSTKVTRSTTIQPIQFGQTYTLPSDWSDKAPAADPHAPKAGFRFQNETVASCMLYQTINGKLCPIYVSLGGPLPPGHEDIIPRAACRVWFERDVENAEMTDDWQSTYIEVDLTQNSVVAVQYDATGTWKSM